MITDDSALENGAIFFVLYGEFRGRWGNNV
jgi:hypothetical protein